MLCVHPTQELIAIERARLAGLEASIQRILQSLHLGFVFLQQPQSCPNYVACRAIATALYLSINEANEVLPEGYGCISAHKYLLVLYQYLPNFSTRSAQHQPQAGMAHTEIFSSFWPA
jgi:hypothetical protein